MGGLGGALVRGVAFLFPGQGSQHPGMGRELYEAFPESREVFERADEAIGERLSATCFSGTDADLARTEVTQPAVLTVSIAAWQALRARGVEAAAAAGHSLGEYSAHVAARTFTFGEAVRTVRLRGRFMQEAVPAGEGAMAAVLGLDRERVEALCAEVAEGDVVSPANLNGPGQVVIAGSAAAVERAVQRGLASGAKRAVPLAVSAPFHCALMAPAAERLAAVLDEMHFEDPSMAVYANVTGAPVQDAATAKELLKQQVVAPVRWQELVERMIADGLRTFVEVGPGTVLAGLVRRIDREVRVFGASDAEGVLRVARELGGVREPIA